MELNQGFPTDTGTTARDTREIPQSATPRSANGQLQKLLEDIVNRFTYHPPAPNQIERYDDLRTAGRNLALMIAATVPASREQALALTHLETAIFFANAAIARNE